jgi:carboxymethylenebutenolidase
MHRENALTSIFTDTGGIETGAVSISTANGELPVYLAVPSARGPFPIVLLVHEIFGVHEHIRDVARRLAKQGYFTLAPELFFRQGDPARIADIPGALRSLVANAADSDVLSDLDRLIEWAGKNGGDAERAAITGFCWGGRIAWLYAAHNQNLKAAVAWYGRLVGEPSANAPRFPIDVAADLKVPVLGLYGGADQGIPLDTVDRMRAALKAGETGSEIVVYEDAPHAFYADYRQSYRAAPAEDGWERLVRWFKAHGL